MRLRSQRSSQNITHPFAQASRHSNDRDQHEGNNTSCSNESKTNCRKVFDIFDSPRRALMEKARKKHNMDHGTNTRYNKIEDDSYRIEMQIETGEYSQDVGSSTGPNVLSWLLEDAPHDIIPKVLSFLGPQKHQALSRVSKSWHKVCLSDGIFRTLCEDYGKWEEEKDGESTFCDVDMDLDEDGSKPTDFWRNVYCSNPIVPLDYPTIQKALDATGRYYEPKRTYEFSKSVRILLSPGFHLIDDCIRVHNYGNAQFSVETLDSKFQKNIYQESSYSNHNYLPFISAIMSDGDSSIAASDSRSTNSCGSLRQIFICRSGSAENSIRNTDELFAPLTLSGSGSFDSTSSSASNYKATIVTKTRRQNSPVFHVTQGKLKISNVAMIHNCAGVDIWNGNTAVQVQPQIVDNRPLQPQENDKMPTAVLEESHITSISGRGVVAIDGGFATIRKCRILNCAATGLYVGGPGSAASVLESDIVRNGNGNERSRRGIGKGHSGVYLEQGVAKLINCNISNNSLTGISAISQTNATLTVKDSDLVGNGTVQLELPPEGSLSRQRSSSENNTISDDGEGRSRVQDLEDEMGVFN